MFLCTRFHKYAIEVARAAILDLVPGKVAKMNLIRIRIFWNNICTWIWYIKIVLLLLLSTTLYTIWRHKCSVTCNLVPRAFSCWCSKWRLVGRRPWQRLTKSPKILEIFITWHFEKNQYKMAAKHRVRTKIAVKMLTLKRVNFMHETLIAS